MADDKSGRDKQARDEDRRQREREIDTELERGDESEPAVDTSPLEYFETALDSLEFPATGAEVVGVIGDRAIELADERYTVEELVPEVDSERFESPSALNDRLQRPTIAAAMKRVVEATDTLPNTELGDSQRDAYEKTFQELKAIDADDEDEGIAAIADWIVEHVREKETLPGSRDVRREAATFCRTNGYEIKNSEWLGI